MSATGSKAVQRTDQGNVWRPVADGMAPSKQLMPFQPVSYSVYTLNETSLRTQLFALNGDYRDAIIISLPMPDGHFREFRVWESSMMPQELAYQYPEIRTFNAEAVNDKRVTGKLDFTDYGFHAVIFEENNTSFIDPYDNYNDGYYFVHYKKDERRNYASLMKCGVHDKDDQSPVKKQLMNTKTLPSTNLKKSMFAAPPASSGPTTAALTTNGTNIRNYDAAVSADHYYCQAATGLSSPTIAQCLSKVTTTMNRVNGIYNREFSVQMNFVANETSIIWPTVTGSINGLDPFDTIDSNPSDAIDTNQVVCDTRIGSANYDVGHVFTTGGGGLAYVGIVCNTGGLKARGVTGSSSPVGDGFDVDYVAHEFGHEFGSSHTFNNNGDGSCSTNASSTHAYEPGSGATIMDYAGICSPDDLQAHSDPYFSGSSVLQITAALAGSENACASIVASGNVPATLTAFSATYNIPYKTPFELTGPTAGLTAADTATTYGWYQWNLGDFGARLNNTYRFGPIFRSYNPAYNPTRVFPAIDSVLKGVLTFTTVDDHKGEKVPDTARYLTFKMNVRTIMAGYGAITVPDDTVHINASSTGSTNGYAGFAVTSQGTTGIVYTGGTTQTVTWNVVGTSAAPVNAANVIIYMSTDGGYTWPYTIGTFPNTGTASVTIPNPASSTTTARIKVKGSGNIFFNVNSKNFTVNPGTPTAAITGTFTLCPTGTTTLSDATSGGTWVSSTPSVATIGSLTGIVTGLTAGTTTISYIASSGTVTAIVTVNPAPTAGTITGGSTVCVGQTTTLSDAVTGGAWSSSNTARATVNSSGVVSGISSGAVTISYAVTNSCGSAVATTNVTVSTGAVIAPITGTMSVCATSTTTLSEVTTGGAWSSSNTAVATVNSSGVVTGVSAGTVNISYSITSTCTSSASTIVTVYALPSVSVSPSGVVNICSSGTATLTATATGVTYQWMTGSTDITGATNATFTTSSAGSYAVRVTNANGCSVTSSPVTVTVTPGATVTPGVSFTATPGLILCTAVPVTFNATSVNGGSSPAYQWSVNGVNTGTGTTYSYTPADGDIVKVVLTSSDVCASPDTAVSSATMSVSGGVTASVSIDPSPNDTVCTGGVIILNAVPVNGGTTPTYLWTVNGINVATGPFYSYTPVSGDVAIVTMTSNHPCVATATVASAPMTLHVQAPSASAITITASSSLISEGESITFTALASNPGTSPIYQWYINSTAVAGATNATYTTDTLHNGQIVSCAVTSSVLCATPGTVMSSGMSVRVAPVSVNGVQGGMNAISLQPNPNKGSFTISGSTSIGGDQAVAISVTNMLGQTIWNKTVATHNGRMNEQVQLGENVAQGMYLVNVTTGADHVVFHMVLERK